MALFILMYTSFIIAFKALIEKCLKIKHEEKLNYFAGNENNTKQLPLTLFLRLRLKEIKLFKIHCFLKEW